MRLLSTLPYFYSLHTDSLANLPAVSTFSKQLCRALSTQHSVTTYNRVQQQYKTSLGKVIGGCEDLIEPSGQLLHTWACMASQLPERRWPLAAVATMTSTGDQEGNFATCERLAKEATAQHAAMLFLPECCSFIGTSQQETIAKAQPLDGPLMQRYQRLAREQQIWLSLGGFQETGPDAEHMYNCHVIISDKGELVTSYRKVHLFDVDVQNGPVLMESRSTAPGNKLVACDSPVGRLGVTVCYDLRFPEVYQQLTFQQSAQILLMPSAFTKVTGEAHWELLLRTRAVECQCYVIAAAQAGKHNEKRESHGHSLIIDPWGKIVASQEDPMATGIAVAPIDLDFLQSVRQRMPIAQHRQQGRTCLGWANG